MYTVLCLLGALFYIIIQPEIFIPGLFIFIAYKMGWFNCICPPFLRDGREDDNGEPETK